ncbi:MAG: hypothetical protein PHD71_08875, partial [Methanospirillum sp.]|nr:hypothetical protein [Methanospirillum sp.]
MKIRHKYRFRVIGVTLLFMLLIAGSFVGTVLASNGEEKTPESGPDVAIIDATVKMDISEMGEIPLGTIP